MRNDRYVGYFAQGPMCEFAIILAELGAKRRSSGPRTDQVKKEELHV